MKKNPHNHGDPTGNSAGTPPVTRNHIQARTRELAAIAGRTPHQVSRSDYQQAKSELTGETDMDRQDAVLDAPPGERRWDPLPGSTGHQAREAQSEDEDDEGRSETEQLVDEGAIEAARDRQHQAARAAADAVQTNLQP